MQYKESLLDKVKAFVKKVLKPSPIGRVVYPYIQRTWKSYSIPRKRRRLHKYGYDVLARMHGTLSKAGILYYCDAGTLLGFVRDGGFIKNDDDIDICIMPDSVSLSKVLRAFLDAGYGYVHGFDYKGRFLEFTVMDPAHISIDVFLHSYNKEDPRYFDEVFLRWFPDREYPSEKANTGLIFKLLAPRGLKMTKVHGVEVVIPANAEEVLDSEYGPWRKPDPDFKSDSLKHTELPGYAYRISLKEALAHK